MRFLALVWGLIALVVFWAALVWGIVFLGYNVLPKKYKEQIYTEDARVRNWPIKATESDQQPGPQKDADGKEGEPPKAGARSSWIREFWRQVPSAADGEGGGPADTALLIDLLLLAAFIIPTSLIGAVSCGMCKGGFGKSTKRSTQVLIGSLLLGVVFWQWRAVPEDNWNTPHLKAMLQYVFWGGWGLALLGTFLVGHFQITGVRQAFLYLRGKEDSPPSGRGGLAAIGRHVLLLGLLVGLMATPKMTLGHLLFSVPMALFVVAWWAVANKKAVAATEPAPTPTA